MAPAGRQPPHSRWPRARLGGLAPAAGRPASERPRRRVRRRLGDRPRRHRGRGSGAGRRAAAGARSASNSRSASPSSQSAASPVGDRRGGHASSCPSTNSRPGRSCSACRAVSAPRITGQSPPTSSGKRPLRRAALTALRTRPIIVISASSASRPDGPRPGCGAGSGRSPASVNPGQLASAAIRPRWRNTAGALATPSTVPLEFAGTPIRTTSRGIIATTLPSRPEVSSGARAHYTYSRLCRRVPGPARPAAAWRPGQQDQHHIPAGHTSRYGWPSLGPGLQGAATPAPGTLTAGAAVAGSGRAGCPDSYGLIGGGCLG